MYLGGLCVRQDRRIRGCGLGGRWVDEQTHGATKDGLHNGLQELEGHHTERVTGSLLQWSEVRIKTWLASG